MAEPVCAQKSPYAKDLAPGDYWWCACGQSKNQPFCDGSHKGSSFTPVKFTVSQQEQKWLCGCKRSKNAPFCDGTHKSLQAPVRAAAPDPGLHDLIHRPAVHP